MRNALLPRFGLDFLLVTMALLTSLSGCCGVILCVPPPTAPCEIETLLIDESVFPEGWEQLGLPRSKRATVSFGVEKSGIGFSTPTRGVAGHDVYRAVSARAAAAGYRDFMSDFLVREGETEWTLPAEISYRSQVADQFRLGCSTHIAGGVQCCQFIGQYGVYLVRFHTYMSPDMMTYEDLEYILQDIDQRMAGCLDR
jgi:hypothetical protein